MTPQNRQRKKERNVGGIKYGRETKGEKRGVEAEMPLFLPTLIDGVREPWRLAQTRFFAFHSLGFCIHGLLLYYA